jgi:serine/threonine protein kinase
VRRLAPETISRLEHWNESDVWAMGVVFWEIFSGSSPFCSFHITESQYTYWYTSGAEPYGAYQNNKEVEATILRGYKLEKPILCPSEL